MSGHNDFCRQTINLAHHRFGLFRRLRHNRVQCSHDRFFEDVHKIKDVSAPSATVQTIFVLYIYHISSRCVYLLCCFDKADLISVFNDVSNPRFRINEWTQTSISTRVLISIDSANICLDFRVLVDEIKKQILRKSSYATFSRWKRTNECKAQPVAQHHAVYLNPTHLNLLNCARELTSG